MLIVPEVVTGDPVIVKAEPVSVNPTDVTVPDPPPPPPVVIIAVFPETVNVPFETFRVVIGRPTVVPSTVDTVRGGWTGLDILITIG